MDNNLLIVIVVVFIIAVVGYRFYRGRAQRRELEGYAKSRGWSYAAHDSSLGGRYLTLFPFAAGDSNRFENVVRFQDDSRTVESFDYQFTETATSSEDSSTTTRFHVVGLELPQPIPQLQVRRASRIPLNLGVLKFESEQFNKRWMVQGEHPAAAHDIIHQGMMEWLLTQDGTFPIALQDTLVFTFVEGRQKTERIDEMLAFLKDFVERIPNHAWQKAEAGEYPRPKRYQMTNDLGTFVRAAKDAMGK